FQLGQSCYLMEDMQHAAEWYEKGLQQKTDPKAEYVQMMVIGYGEALLAMERNTEALDYFKGIYDLFSFTPEFVFLMGQIYLNNGMLLQAYAEYLKCLQMKPNRTEGVTSFYAYHSIALINEMLGEKEAAIGFYRKAGDYPRSVQRLKELEGEKA
ncbi:MAG: glycosyl transferase family 2, partial [Lachnospiraceae bacterium]|nr:glycosyl transferase family 2 [Lachnospiraceae bacterium]